MAQSPRTLFNYIDNSVKNVRSQPFITKLFSPQLIKRKPAGAGPLQTSIVKKMSRLFAMTSGSYPKAGFVAVILSE